MRGKQFFEGKTIRDWAIACFTPQQSVKPMVSNKQFFFSRMFKNVYKIKYLLQLFKPLVISVEAWYFIFVKPLY